LIDWVIEHPERSEAAIRTPPARRDPLFDNLLAGIAETIADDAGRPLPKWCEKVDALGKAWAPAGTPSMRQRARANAVPRLRARNVLVTEADLGHVPNAA
jgi:hypothetical protein